MAFPTIPTSGAGRIIAVQSVAETGTTHTSPDLSSLTKNAGDLLIAIVLLYDGNSSNAEFSSWGGSFTEFGDFATTTTLSIGCAYKFSTGSETGTFTVTSSGSAKAAFFLMSIAGAHPSTIPEAGGYATGTNANANPGSLDPAGWGTEDTLWIAVVGTGEDATAGSFTSPSAAPANFTSMFTRAANDDVVGSINAAVAFRQNTAGSEDPGTFTNDTSNIRWGAITIAVRPVADVAVTPSTVAGTGSVPSITISAVPTLTTSTVAGTGSTPAVTVSATADVAVSTVAGTGSVPSVSISTAGPTDVPVATVVGTGAVPSVAISVPTTVAVSTVAGIGTTYGTFDPSSIPNLVSRVETFSTRGIVESSGAVSSWQDQASGVNYDQATGTAKPTHGIRTTPSGVGALDFDGSSDHLLQTATRTVGQGHTVFFVLCSDEGANGVGKTMWRENNTGGAATMGFQKTAANQWAAVGNAVNIITGAIVDTNWHVFVMRLDGANGAGMLQIDQTRFNGSLGNGTTSSFSVRLGGNAAPTTFMDGGFAAFLDYDRILTDVEVAQIVTYLDSVYIAGTGLRLSTTANVGVSAVAGTGAVPAVTIDVPAGQDVPVSTVAGTGSVPSVTISTTANVWLTPTFSPSDTFNRADSSTSLGSTDVGSLPWIAQAGTWGISSNRAYVATNAGDNQNTAVVDTGFSDGVIQVTVPAAGDGSICFRSVDNNNHFVIGSIGAAVQLYKRTAGSYSGVLTSGGSLLANGDVVQVILNGDSIQCRINGVVAFNFNDSSFQTATKHGLRTYGGGPAMQFDDWSFVGYGPVRGIGSVPAVNISTGSSTNVSVSTVAGTGSVPSVTISATATVAPATVAGTGTVRTVTLSATANVAVSAVAGTGSVPAVTLVTPSNVLVSTVAGTGTVRSVTIATTATVAPSTVAATGSVPAVTIVIGTNVAVSAVAGTGSVPSVAIAFSGAATPATVAGTGAVPSVTISTTAVVAPSTVAGTGTVRTVTISASAVVAPATVAGTGSVPAVSIQTGGSTTVPVSAVAGTGSVPAVTISATSSTAPATVAGTGTVRTVTINTTATAPVAPVAGIGSVPAVTIAASATVSVSPVAASGIVRAVAIATTAQVPLTVVAGVGSVPSVAIKFSGMAIVLTVAGIGSVPSVTIVFGVPEVGLEISLTRVLSGWAVTEVARGWKMTKVLPGTQT